MVNYIEDVLEEVKRARAEPLSETHDNSTYEGTKDSESVYIKSPFKALIDCKRSLMGIIIQKIMKQKYLFLGNKVQLISFSY